MGWPAELQEPEALSSATTPLGEPLVRFLGDFVTRCCSCHMEVTLHEVSTRQPCTWHLTLSLNAGLVPEALLQRSCRSRAPYHCDTVAWQTCAEHCARLQNDPLLATSHHLQRSLCRALFASAWQQRDAALRHVASAAQAGPGGFTAADTPAGAADLWRALVPALGRSIADKVAVVATSAMQVSAWSSLDDGFTARMPAVEMV